MRKLQASIAKRMIFGFLTIVLIATSSIASSREAHGVAASKYGGSIVVGLGESIPGFCVGNNPSLAGIGAYRAIYETLVERDSSGGLTGLLAESVVPNSTKDVWTITLKSGITYHDGSALDATNVAMNLNAMRGTLYSYQLANSYLLGTAVAVFANILQVDVRSALVLDVTLERPQNDFPETLYSAGRAFMRSSAQFATSSTCINSPIGTGPFKISGSWDSSNLTVVRNANYWRHDVKTGDQLPYLDQITFHCACQSRGTDLQSGALDVAAFSSYSDGAAVTDLRQQGGVFNEYVSLGPRVDTLWLNVGKPGSPFANANARRALAYATDRSRYQAATSGSSGVIPDGLFPKNSELYTKSGTREYDLAKAHEYVDAYKADTGLSTLEFTLPVAANATASTTATVLQSMWAEAGITAHLVVEEYAVIISKMFRSTLSGGSQNMYDAVQSGLIYGAETALNTMFLLNDVFKPNSASSIDAGMRSKLGTLLGLTHHGDTNVDTKFFLAQAQVNPKFAAEKYREAVAYFQEKAYAIPISQTTLTFFTRKNIGGIGRNYLSASKFAQFVNPWGFDWGVVYQSQTPVNNAPVAQAANFQEVSWTGGNPRSVVADSSGDFVYVAKTNEGLICKVLLSTGTESSCYDVGGRPLSLVRPGTSSIAYFVDEKTSFVRRINLNTGSATDVVHVNGVPSSIAVSTDSTLAYVASPETSRIYKVAVGASQVTSEISISGNPSGLVLSANGDSLWVSLMSDDQVVRLATSSDAVTNTVNVGQMPGGMSISPSGKYLYVANQNSGSVTRIDTGSRVADATFEAGVQPVAMSLSADQQHAYIANAYTNSIGSISVPAEPRAPEATPIPIAPVQVVDPPVAVVAPVVVSGPTASVPTISPASTSVSSLSGTSVSIARKPVSTIATDCAVAISSTKVNVGLVVPKAKTSAAQIVKYVVQLIPRKGGPVLSRTISVLPGKTVKPTLVGKSGLTYSLTVTAVTKSGKKSKWSGPAISIPQKK